MIGGVGRSCSGEDIIGGWFFLVDETKGESGSGWTKVGGERNEKSSGILEFSFMVYNIL